jgi:hypothetical protein
MDELIDKLDLLVEARNERKAAVAKCEYDADYFCAREYDREKLCQQDFEQALDDYIDARIRSALAYRDNIQAEYNPYD